MDLLFGSAIFTSMWLYITSNIVWLTCLVSFSEEKKSYTDFSFREWYNRSATKDTHLTYLILRTYFVYISHVKFKL